MNMVMTPIYSVPTAAGRAEPPLAAAAVATVAQLVPMFFLIPAYGIVGAAWSNVGVCGVWTLVLVPVGVSPLIRGRDTAPHAAAPAPARRA